jgi:hypothetical protein
MIPQISKQGSSDPLRVPKVEYEHEEEDELSIRFAASPQPLKTASAVLRRKPLFRRGAREKA